MKELVSKLLSVFLLPVLMCIGHGTYSGTGLMKTDVVEKSECIEISGSIGDSGIRISRVTTKKDKHDVIVKLHWILCGVPHLLADKGSHGNGVHAGRLDHYKVPISADVDRILMGEKRIVIWERGATTKSLPAASATSADSITELRHLIKSDNKGRILSVDYSDPKPQQPWDPMVKQHGELLKAISIYAPGRKSSELKELLGRPRAIESKVSVNSWPERASKSQQVWLYTCGPDGWGCTVVFCFTDDICKDVIRLDWDQYHAYEQWKTNAIEVYAPGKSAGEILMQFGEPDDRNGPKQLESWTNGQKTIYSTLGDETWTYRALDNQGTWVGMKNGKCVKVEPFTTLH